MLEELSRRSLFHFAGRGALLRGHAAGAVAATLPNDGDISNEARQEGQDEESKGGGWMYTDSETGSQFVGKRPRRAACFQIANTRRRALA